MSSGKTRQAGNPADLTNHDQLKLRLAGARTRWAQRRAHAALTCARFTDPDVAADVLRQVQVLTMTAAMARLDYTRPDDAHAAIGNLITSPAARGPQPGIVPVPVSAPEPAVREPAGAAGRTPAARINGHAAGGVVTSPGEPPVESADGTPAPALVPAAATDAMRESAGPAMAPMMMATPTPGSSPPLAGSSPTPREMARA